MGYSVYEDRDAHDHGVSRWAGYGVPAVCDWPTCSTEINRGLGFKCERRYIETEDGEEIEEDGCGLYFCIEHLALGCVPEHDGFTPKPDTAEWEQWMLTDESWEPWREEHPEVVAQLRQRHDLEKAS